MLGLARFVTHGSGGSGPSLNFNFADDSPYLSQQITFTRASAGTFTGANGLIQNAPVNLLTYSEEFDNAAWTATRSSITTDASTAPDGTATADKLVEDTTASSTHVLLRTVSVSPSTTYTATVYVKAAERTRVDFNFGGTRMTVANGGTGADISTVFDLSAGEMVAGTGTAYNPQIISVGNGWYRISITGTTGSAGSGFIVNLYLVSSGTTTSYTGNGTSGIFIWGAQLVEGSVAGPYVRTVASTSGAPRFDYDPVTLAAKGLLIEEQRTNLLTYSEQFDNAAWAKGAVTITSNTEVAPDGTMSADGIFETTATSSHQAYQGASCTSGTSYTMSVYAKQGIGTRRLNFAVTAEAFGSERYATFNLDTATATAGSGVTASIISVGNGWFRCVATVTATATATSFFIFRLATSNSAVFYSYTGDGTSGIYIWGAQLEAGSFATSYIPTVASQVTRSPDLASVNTLSPWFNATEGTFVAQFDYAGGTSADNPSNRFVLAVSSGSSSNLHAIYNRISVAQSGLTTTGGVVQASPGSGSSINANVITTAGYAYKQDDFAFAYNGGAATTDTSGTVPSGLTILGIGGPGYVAPAYISGHIRRITYYPRRLPNATLQQITA